MRERRSQVRLSDSELVMIGWVEKEKSFKQLGNVNDISLDGMGIRVDYPLPVGTSVTISYDALSNGTLIGTVRHHSQGLDGHILGIELEGRSKDSTLHFQPELLIDFE
jgi:PilZ domain-containing protein